MQEIFQEILASYGQARTEQLKNHKIAVDMRGRFCGKIIEEAGIDDGKYLVSGSAGQGSWATVPWIGIFNKAITKTAQEGYYIVYLFPADMSGVYLSLNQGWSFFENNFGVGPGRENIKKVSKSWRNKLHSHLDDFEVTEIDLRADGKSPLPCGYECGHIMGKYYAAKALPTNTKLVGDLRNLMGVYRELESKLGAESYKVVNRAIIAEYDSSDVESELDDLIARGDKIELTLLGDRPADFRRVRLDGSSESKKIDHISRQRVNQKLGQLGENAVVAYEKDRLARQGLKKLADKVYNVAQEEGDGAGYDIRSYFEDGEELYIEVKTTSGGIDQPFYISQNELLFSEQNAEKYRLYRIFNFDRKKGTGQLYVVKGSLKKVLGLEPTDYVVTSFIDDKN